MFVAGYVVEGLVPVEIVRELLAEKPAIAGSRCRACSWLARHAGAEDQSASIGYAADCRRVPPEFASGRSRTHGYPAHHTYRTKAARDRDEDD